MKYLRLVLNLLVRIVDLVWKNPDRPLARSLPNPIAWLRHRYFKERVKACRLRWLEKEVANAKANYPKQIERIRHKIKKGGRVKILFIVDELAKWKAESLYSLLRKDKRFEPVICLGLPTCTYGVAPRETARRMAETEKWFRDRAYNVIRLYDAFKDKLFPIEPLEPDIVFYPEVWYDTPLHLPSRISKIALTCYIPYFVPNYVDVFLDCQQEMHRLYWRHFVLNEELADVYRKATVDRSMAGRFVASGHPMLDYFLNGKHSGASSNGRRIIIYAPHWTFDHPNNQTRLKYSTFDLTGKPILEYAKKHPEFEWVFKPHPRLYTAIVTSGLMTKEQADEYYAKWGEIGATCLDASYMKMFNDSFALITDCGSFLSEYVATGKPIIHLISIASKIEPPAPIKSLYDTYYKVHDLTQLKETLRNVVEKGLDPNKEVRCEMAKRLRLVNTNAARNIYDCIAGELKVAQC